jgi:hypothetical protein
MNRTVRPLRSTVAGRLAAVCLPLAVLALVPGAPALAASTAVAGTSAAGGAIAPAAPATVTTTVPTIATTTPTSTPAAPAATVPPTPGAAASPGSQAPGAPASTKKSGGGELSGGAILAAIIAGLIALACLVWGIFRIGAFEPHWLLSARHSVAEAGFRAAGTWDEFTDWLRLGH